MVLLAVAWWAAAHMADGCGPNTCLAISHKAFPVQTWAAGMAALACEAPRYTPALVQATKKSQINMVPAPSVAQNTAASAKCAGILRRWCRKKGEAQSPKLSQISICKCKWANTLTKQMSMTNACHVAALHLVPNQMEPHINTVPTPVAWTRLQFGQGAGALTDPEHFECAHNTEGEKHFYPMPQAKKNQFSPSLAPRLPDKSEIGQR